MFGDVWRAAMALIKPDHKLDYLRSAVLPVASFFAALIFLGLVLYLAAVFGHALVVFVQWLASYTLTPGAAALSL
jgi:hypothetical protein